MTFFGAMGAAALAMVRLVRPNVLPERSSRYKIGGPGSFPPGAARIFAEGKFAVFAGDDGLYAISLVCTHLGCVVLREGTGFTCPCHVSKFSAAGDVQGGPAPKGLPWLQIEQHPSGRLAVDTSVEVPVGTRFLV